MVRDMFHFRLFKIEKRRPLLKDPMAFFSAEWLASAFDMQIVVIIRHPAAFAGSLKIANWRFPFSHLLRQRELVETKLRRFKDQIELFAAKEKPIVEQAALLWNMIYSANLHYQADHPDWLFIRHEDLSLNPEKGFQNVYHCLDLNFTDIIKQKIFEYSGSHNPNERIKAGSVRRNSVTNMKTWRQRLTDNEIIYMREATGKVAAHYYDDADW